MLRTLYIAYFLSHSILHIYLCVQTAWLDFVKRCKMCWEFMDVTNIRRSYQCILQIVGVTNICI